MSNLSKVNFPEGNRLSSSRKFAVAPFSRDAVAPSFTIDYRGLLFRFLRNWYWFALVLVACLTLAWLHLRYAIPEYTTSAIIIIEDNEMADGVSERAIGQELGFYDAYNVEDELHVIRSEELMKQVVEALKLDVSYIHQGRVKDTEIYRPKTFQLYKIDSLNAAGRIDYGSVTIGFHSNGELSLVRGEQDTIKLDYNEPFLIGNQYYSLQGDSMALASSEASLTRISVRDPYAVAGEFTGKLSVRQIENSQTIEVGIRDVVPERGADVVNTLIAAYNEDIIKKRNRMGAQTLDFLDERLSYVSKELYSVEASMTGFKESQNVVTDLSESGASYLSQLNEADGRMAELEVRKDLIDQLRRRLANEGPNEYKPLSVASEIIDGTLTLMVQEYNKLIFERDNKLEAATPENPAVITYTEQLVDLKRSLKQSVETLYEETDERIRKINSRIVPIEQSMSRIPQNQQRLVQILRQAKIKENLFVFLMEKRENAALAVAGQVPNTRLVESARPHYNPISPNPKQTYLLAFGLGLLLPALAMFMGEIFNTKIQSEKEIDQQTQLPIVGRVANSDKKGDVVITEESRSSVAEMFRLLRTNLTFLLADIDKPVLLVTSAIGGEGKTFIASNLGRSIALSEQRVVLLEADMRKPRLTASIHGSEPAEVRPGLSSYLIGAAKYEEIIREGDIPGLFYVESGPIPPNPSELLLKSNMTELIKRLEEDFDFVIIDSAPVGMVTDAFLFKNLVDATLYITRLGHTPKRSMEVLADLETNYKLPSVGIVVNGLRPNRDYGYGYATAYYK